MRLLMNESLICSSYWWWNTLWLREQWCNTLLIFSLAQAPQGGQMSASATQQQPLELVGVFARYFSLVTFCPRKRLNPGLRDGFVSLYLTSLSQLWLWLLHWPNAVFIGYSLAEVTNLKKKKNLSLFIKMKFSCKHWTEIHWWKIDTALRYTLKWKGTHKKKGLRDSEHGMIISSTWGTSHLRACHAQQGQRFTENRAKKHPLSCSSDS